MRLYVVIIYWVSLLVTCYRQIYRLRLNRFYDYKFSGLRSTDFCRSDYFFSLYTNKRLIILFLTKLNLNIMINLVSLVIIASLIVFINYVFAGEYLDSRKTGTKMFHTSSGAIQEGSWYPKLLFAVLLICLIGIIATL